MILHGTFRSLTLGWFVQNPPSLLQSPSKFCFHRCCCSVAKSCVDCSTSGFPIHHYLQVCSDSYLLSQWCHPTISSSVALFTSCLQSFPASGSFPMSQFFESGGQSIGASASASVLPKNVQDWFPLGLTGLISLQSKGFSRVFSSTTIQKHQFFGAQPSLWSNSHIHTWLLLSLSGPLIPQLQVGFLLLKTWPPHNVHLHADV